MSRYEVLAVGGAVCVLPYAWLVGASYVYCSGIGHPELFAAPFTQWLEVLPYWNLNWWITLWMAVSALAPTIVLGLSALILVQRHRRSVSQVYGKTEWASHREMKAGSISTGSKPF